MTDELKAAVERAWIATACKATGDKHDVTSTFIRALADEPLVIEELWEYSNLGDSARHAFPDILHRLAEIVK